MATRNENSVTGRAHIGRRRQAADKEPTPNTRIRRSARLQQKRLNGVKPTPLSPRKPDEDYCIEQEQQQPGGSTRKARAEPKSRDSFKRHHNPKFRLPLVEQNVGKTATRSRRVEGDDSAGNHSLIFPTPEKHIGEFRPSAAQTKDELIYLWRDSSCVAQQTFPDLIGLPRTPPEDMSTLTGPFRSVAFGENISSFSKKSKYSTTLHGPGYRENTLLFRNIHVNRETPPTELKDRATEITTKSRMSPELDDAAVEQVKSLVRRLEDQPEELIKIHLTPRLGLSQELPSKQELVQSSGGLWCDAVLIPPRPRMVELSMHLRRPKPDLAFGYSKSALTEAQFVSSMLLTSDETSEQLGKSYARPENSLLYPFFTVEFKSQANQGTHFTASNQAAVAGAIGLNGVLEVFRRGLGLAKLNLDQPQFFSLTVDHELARLNIHWLRLAEDGQYHFHMAVLSKHLLDDAAHLKALHRAIKNIFDYSTERRLQVLCAAIDACGQETTKAGTKISEGTTTGNVGVEEQGKLQPQTHPQPSPLKTDIRLPSALCPTKRAAKTTEDVIDEGSVQKLHDDKRRKT
ncbi:MAG: hypothetical protein M4579_001707 [Chaenotheca gracillima]|nr:MAG: hypothetical protein M4579_001707 [Chaenotheca gracillima]